MGSSQPSGPALVAAAADADPVTLLVTAWLSARRSARRSESTQAGYARDIGITPPRRPGRAPSWLIWCREQGVHPVTGVTMLYVARYARQLETAGLSPASAARKLAAISSWYAWLARRGHISASPAAGVARPRPGPRTPPAPALTPGQVLALINAADTAPGSHTRHAGTAPGPGPCPCPASPTTGKPRDFHRPEYAPGPAAWARRQARGGSGAGKVTGAGATHR